MLKQNNEPQLVDTTDLTDADWAEINKIKQAYAKRGQKGFEKALDALHGRESIKLAEGVFGLLPNGGQRSHERQFGYFGSNSRRFARVFWKYGKLSHQALAALALRESSLISTAWYRVLTDAAFFGREIFRLCARYRNVE